jgi:hypothetical protein
VNEAYLFTNDGKTAWNDPVNGTLQFYLPPGANGKVRIDATAPGGMPLQQPAGKTGKPDVYKVDFPVRPGETRIDLSYVTPYKEGETYTGKVVTQDENTYLIVPKGVTLTGDNLNDMGEEPRTQAHLYGLKEASYKIALSGTAAPAAQDAGADTGSQDGAPQIQEIMPRLYTRLWPILGLALGILALGFVLLYRTPAGANAAKESHDRGHR